MFTFKEYRQMDDQILLENNQAIKSHLSHLEDLAVEKGIQGFKEFIQHVDAILRRVKGLTTQQQVNLKVDGQMMLLFGVDPRPNFKGQFFVATKSGLGSKNPKINHSLGEIGKNYPDYDMAEKLKMLLISLSKAYDQSGNIYQCDVLFCLPQDKKTVEIDGEKYLIFTPNTITYAIPFDTESELFKRVVTARVGVVIHEALRGVSFNDGKAIQLLPKTRDVSSIVESGKRANVFIEGSNFKKLKFKPEDSLLQSIEEHISIAETNIAGITQSFDKEYTSNSILEYIKRYLNKQVEFSNGGMFGAAVRREKFSFNLFVRGFKTYLKSMFGAEALKRKTKKGKWSVNSKRGEVITWLDNNNQSMDSLLRATFHMVHVKLLILKLFKQIETKLGKTFIQQSDGSFKATDQEGFVFFIGNNHVKIVDRLEFSKQNRLNNPRFG
jgi:hypothetical protein